MIFSNAAGRSFSLLTVTSTTTTTTTTTRKKKKKEKIKKDPSIDFDYYHTLY